MFSNGTNRVWHPANVFIIHPKRSTRHWKHRGRCIMTSNDDLQHPICPRIPLIVRRKKEFLYSAESGRLGQSARDCNCTEHIDGFPSVETDRISSRQATDIDCYCQTETSSWDWSISSNALSNLFSSASTDMSLAIGLQWWWSKMKLRDTHFADHILKS